MTIQRLFFITAMTVFLLSVGYWLREQPLFQTPPVASSDTLTSHATDINTKEIAMRFPAATGSNLQRKKLMLPADFDGELNIILVAFEQWQQNTVNTWLPFVEQLEQGYDSVRYYELPVIKRMNFIARTFINEGMRAGIPDTKARNRTITLYLDKVAFRDALDLPHERDIYVLIVDREGNIVWRTEGAFTSDKGEALTRAIETHRGKNDPINQLNFEDYQWQNRLLLLFAPNSKTGTYVEQLRFFAEQPNEIIDRDLLIISLFGQEMGRLDNHSISMSAANAAREKFNVAEDSFALLLIGKDGGVKFRSDQAASPDQIFALIDSMPMRQQEMRERQVQ
jgi:predicted transcriptional regulator